MQRKILLSILVFIISILYSYSQIYNKKQLLQLDKPIIKSVTVNQDINKVVIEWYDVADADGYIIYHYEEVDYNMEWVAIDTSYTNSYTDINSSPLEEEDKYQIVAFGTNDDNSEKSDEHQIMLLLPVYEMCYDRVKLLWNAYKGWEDGIMSYEIYIKAGDYPRFILMDSLGGGITETIIEEIEKDVDFLFYVKATSNTGVVSVSALTAFSQATSKIIIDSYYATSVGEYNQIELSFITDPKLDIISNYVLIHSNNSNFYGVDTVATFQKNQEPPLKYVDYVDIGFQKHYYKLLAINSCGMEIKSSSIEHNSLLKVTAQRDMTNLLVWDAYKRNYSEDEGDGVEAYEIFRSVDKGEPISIAVVEKYDNEFEDDLNEFIQDYIDTVGQAPQVLGQFCYHIEVIGKRKFADSIVNVSSISNVACVSQKERVFIPNTFTPDMDGNNDYFLPKITFASPNKYLIKIFNRWGNVVFESTDYTEAWDGKTKNGKPVQTGTYIYYIKFRTSNYRDFEKTGNITLIRN